jgi:hypothetical protein
MQAAGAVRRPGVATPDESVPPERYIADLAERGIEIRFEER